VSELHGISYPTRAEYLDEARFQSYKVELDFWDPLTAQLWDLFRRLAMRSDTGALLVHADQGAGKTLLAKRLESDIAATPRTGPLVGDPMNIWHRIAGGAKLDVERIREGSSGLKFKKVRSTIAWVEDLTTELNARAPDEPAIVVADNAERAYFLQGLLREPVEAGLSVDFSGPQALRIAAQEFVARCRDEWRGVVFLLLTNDSSFAHDFKAGCDLQHRDLVRTQSLPTPPPERLEAVVRVNTNRLNPYSYWACLDNAGPDEKREVQQALLAARSFADSFAAVDRAATTDPAKPRVGRPGAQNVLSLAVLFPFDDADGVDLSDFGEARDPFRSKWLRIQTHSRGWAQGLDEHDRGLLESEWEMRIVLLGAPFVAALLSATADPTAASAVTHMLDLLGKTYTLGTLPQTKLDHEASLSDVVSSWPEVDVDLTGFWSEGQGRSTTYEPVLRSLVPRYDKAAPLFGTNRPDLVVRDYVPCAVTRAKSEKADSISNAIKRDAHMIEFTAQKAPSGKTLKTYLATKVPNYVRVTQES
jgi:hypothetical protein